MIIKLGFYRRKPGISVEEFRHLWSEVYGPMYGRYPELARHIRRYVHHRLTPTDDDPETILPYDGFSEAWFDSIEDSLALVEEPIFKEKVSPLVESFLDYENSKISMVDSQVYQIGGAPVLIGD